MSTIYGNSLDVMLLQGIISGVMWFHLRAKFIENFPLGDAHWEVVSLVRLKSMGGIIII